MLSQPLSRRRFLASIGVGGGAVAAVAATASNPSLANPAKPESTTLRHGNRFVALTDGDARSALLVEFLTVAGFEEGVDSAHLREDFAQGAREGAWVAATVAYGVMQHPDGLVANLSTIMSSRDAGLAARPPEAVICRPPAQRPVKTLTVVGTQVQER